MTGANLRVSGGEVVLIVGGAGVGTSRLVAAALGELALAQGRLDVLGRDVGKLRRSSLRLLRRRIGVVPQDLCLLEDRSAQLNVMLPLEIDGIPRSMSLVRASEALERVGLLEQAMVPVHHLPVSARQRIAVARALVREPDLVIADQPTSVQDRDGAALVCAALAECAARGAAVLVLGRDPHLCGIADQRDWRVLMLADGALSPIGEVALDARSIDDVLLEMRTAPVAMPSNLIKFPQVEEPAA